MLKIVKKNLNLFFLVLSVIITIPAIVGFLHGGFPLTDDGNWMVIRFSAFYETLRSGQFPVRFLMRLNNGYGYPVSDFLYPLFMYIGVPIHAIGLSFLDTIKSIIILSLISSSVFTFLWLRKIFDNISSLIGSLVYTLFPYHLFDAYKRGSVGEVLSLSILPFVLWQVEKGNLLFISFGVALLILAHNTLAFLFIPLIIFYISLRNKENFKVNILSVFFGFLISSFFWIPALFDKQFTVFDKTSVSEISSYFIDKNPQLLGLIFLLVVLESVFYSFRKKDKNLLKLFIVLLIFTFLLFSQSKFVWDILPFTNLIQFPFRIISLIIPTVAFMAAYLLNKEKNTTKYFLSAVYIVLILISAYSFLSPKSYQNFPDSFYSTNQDTTTVKNEYMPVWVKNVPQKMADVKVVNIGGNEKINLLQQTANKTVFETFLNSSRVIRVNTVYFPGWNAYVNGIKTNIDYKSNNGLMDLRLKKGVNNVVIKFEETDVRFFSNLLSCIGVIITFVLYYLIKYKKIKI